MAVVPLKLSASQTNIPVSESRASLEARLERHGLLDVPVSVDEVAEFLGLEINREIMDKDMSGYLELRRGRWIVGVNSLHHRTRQRFTIAHEIAHFMLHGSANSEFHDKTFARRSNDPNPIERAADQFAAELLMPEEALRRAITAGCNSLQDLANQFDVSALAMKYRVQGLGYRVK